ncbi:MAG: hypothetical protein QJR12_05760 [Mycobacterium sp.]|uniref:hypothetical protein n=1 Tax=Mycobacterium sp. TaxID=1785 RepID=UPI0026257B04|nr:hypothetical protein [Mycobacterium sp.]MDI3313793.1 hypothetical protein [Mycobacterium sp.]
MTVTHQPPARRGAGRRRTEGSAARTRERKTARSGPQTAPMPRPVERSARPTSTRQAKARSKARKAKAPKVIRVPLRDRVIARLMSVDLRPRTLVSKVPFVVLVIGSLAVGLGVTLWLSTDSAERSYELGNAREQTRILRQQKEALERDVLQAQSAPALAEEARNLGMIPTRDTAHLVQDPAGNWVVVGTPKPADGVPPPPLNTKLPDEKPTPPPPPQQVNSVELPVRMSPGAAVPTPEVLVRAPDGATTLGVQHPGAAAEPPAPPPGPGPSEAAPAPQPGSPTVGAPAPGAPGTPVPVPAAAPSVAVTPDTAGPTVAPGGEQFGPLTIASPGDRR